MQKSSKEVLYGETQLKTKECWTLYPFIMNFD